MSGVPHPLPYQVRVEESGPYHAPAETYGPRSSYVEMAWLPILGPTATWVYRRMGILLMTHPDGYVLHFPDLAQDIGLERAASPLSELVCAFDRLIEFDILEWPTDEELFLNLWLPPLMPFQLEMLTPSARAAAKRLQAIECRPLDR